MHSTVTAMVSTIDVPTSASRNRRNIRSSSEAERRGPSTPSTRTAASGVGQAHLLLELPVHERRDHPEGAVGEVEDAGGRVGEDEAGGGDGVDAAGGDAEDRELQELGAVAGPGRTPRW